MITSTAESNRVTTPTWWGDYRLSEGATAEWEVGTLRITVQRFLGEWLVAQQQIELEEEELGWRFAIIEKQVAGGDYGHYTRYVCQETEGTLSVLPALADRPVVTRPFNPFSVIAGEQATVYISTPLWFTLATSTSAQLLHETPIKRPSDTWFGPSTLEGEVCYASRTYARLNLENIPARPHRALTQIQILNNSGSALQIERLNLPVPYLSLFATADGALWTEAVSMIHAREGDFAEFSIDADPPPEAEGARKIAASRRNPQENMLVRAFSALRL